MAHIALARKYRPKKFDDIVGQPHISNFLRKAIVNGKISQAYLFTGTRGVGKTTTARLLAMSVNCENPQNGNPCLKCASCQDILHGTSMDVIEIDGASNTSVDDVRKLREEIGYAPVYGKYKVYIIDEVHMLSRGAFNALLKILEEPPEHVIFVFATTEPHKIPETILSRCQRFDFRRVPEKEIVERFKYILKEEGFDWEDDALYLIARKANGSVRDGISLLDQIYSFSDGKITYELTKEILGIVDYEIALNILKNLKEKKLEDVFKIIEDLDYSGIDFGSYTEDFLNIVRDVLIAKITPEYLKTKFTDVNRINNLIQVSMLYSQKELIRFINIINKVLSEMKYSTNPRNSFEIMMLKLIDVFDSFYLSDIIDDLKKK